MNEKVELFLSSNLRVTYLPGSQPDLIVVTFVNLDNAQNLYSLGFAERFIGGRYHCIFVNCVSNVWYQYPETIEAIQTIANHTSKFKNVIGYGASMGAYAAILFSGRIGSSRTLAVAPQFSIDPAKVPFEKRWPDQQAGINEYFCDDLGKDAAGRIDIIYDPFCLDRNHVELIRKQIPVFETRLNYAGHSIPDTLHNMGLLKTMVQNYIDESYDRDELIVLFKKCRSKSLSYTRNLCAIGRNIKRKINLLERVLRGPSPDPMALTLIGDFYFRDRRLNDAEAALREALALRPKNAWILSKLSFVLAAKADLIIEESISMGKNSSLNEPKNPWFHYNSGSILKKFGRNAEAKASFSVAAEIDPGNEVFRRAASSESGDV